MKLSRKYLIPLLLATILTGIMTMGASQYDKPEKEPIDKIVFVHYPKNDAAGKANGPSTSGTSSCPDYKYSGYKWKNQQVTYYINPTNVYVDPTTTANALIASMATWDSASPAFGFLSPTTSNEVYANGSASDGKNVISWGTVSQSNAIAVTYIWYGRFTKNITECDTVMNSALPWSYTAPDGLTSGTYPDPANSGTPGAYDIQNIMTHEAGHWIMLNDLYNARDSFLTMYGYGSHGEIKKDTLGYGDILGVQKTYGN